METWRKGGKESKTSRAVSCTDVSAGFAAVHFPQLEPFGYGQLIDVPGCALSLFWVGATPFSVLQKELSRTTCDDCELEIVDGLTLTDSTLHLRIIETEHGLVGAVDERWRPNREALIIDAPYVGFRQRDGGVRIGSASSQCPDGGVSRDCFHIDIQQASR